MESQDLISELIELQDKANAHTSEYVRLLGKPGCKSKASSHYRKAERLRAKIQELIKKIAAAKGPNPGDDPS